MAVQTGKKLNWLERELPEGLLVDARWLEKNGISRSLRSQYVGAGWLEQPARGVYRRPRGTLSWEQVVISLQTLLSFPVSVGGRTALELQGYAHYLSQSPQFVHLYVDTKLPGWVSKLPGVGDSFAFHNRTRFLPEISPAPETWRLSLDSEPSDDSRETLPGALRLTRWGQWKWPMIMSTPERAFLELLDELPNRESFHEVAMLMEGLVDFSPRRAQQLLERASSVKVKRLFFFFADRHGHRWLNRVDRENVDLGKGKRMLVRGGKLDSTYQITVPEELDGIQ